MGARTEFLTVRVAPDELERRERLANRKQLTLSGLVREKLGLAIAALSDAGEASALPGDVAHAS